MNRYKSRNKQQRYSFQQRRTAFGPKQLNRRSGHKQRRNLPPPQNQGNKKFNSNSFNRKKNQPLRMKKTFLEQINQIANETSHLFDSKDSKHKLKTKSGKIYNKSLYSIKYKTKLCVEIIQNGKCRYGQKCSFAHSHSELREINDTVKVWKACKNYHIDKVCFYGQKC